MIAKGERLPRSPLQAARMARNLTQQQAVDGVLALFRAEGDHSRGLTVQMLCAYEAGERPGWEYAIKLCQYYRATAEQLGFLPNYSRPQPDERPALDGGYAGAPAQSVEQEIGVHRRRFAGALGTTLGAAVLDALGMEQWAMARALESATVDSETLDYLEATTDEFGRRYPTAPTLPLLASVLEHFHLVRLRLEDPQPVPYRRRLCREAARLGGLLGTIAINFEDYARARSYFHVALKAAKEAGDGVLAGWVLARHSFIHTYTDEPDEALVLLRQGRYLAGRRWTAVHGLLAAREARALAPLGRGRDCQKAIAEAERGLEAATADQRRDVTFGFTPQQLVLYVVPSYVELGWPGAAQKTADDGSRLFLPTEVRDPAYVRISLARSYAQQGEVDRAAALALELLDLPEEHREALLVARVRRLATTLASYHPGAPGVLDLQERLALV